MPPCGPYPEGVDIQMFPWRHGVITGVCTNLGDASTQNTVY